MILMTMPLGQFSAPNGAHQWLHVKPLDAAIRQVPTLYFPYSCHGHWYLCKQ
jgi:hypothetical protein